MSKRYIPISVLFLPLVLLGTSCEPTFEPLRQNHQFYFSMNGYLDAEADIQWVRIMPVRDSLFFEPKPIDATVTLEEVGSGQSTTMNDSMFSYSQDAYTYNFRTTMEVQPNRTTELQLTNM